MAQIDSLTRRLALMASDARTRSFGVRDGSQTQVMIRHGYLLALEEIERALDAQTSPQTASSPRDAA